MKTLAAVPLLALATGSLAQEEAPKPTKYHEFLKQFEGTWEGTVKFSMEPGQEPIVSKGTMTEKLSCGGLWLVYEWKGEMMRQPFTGHGLMGYDVKKGKYVSVWVDSWMTAVGTSEGTCDEKGRVFTMAGEDDDAKSGKKVKRKEVTEFADADNWKMTFSVVGDGGKDFVMMTIEMKRKK
ncbi:MAG: DUF1579 domain-containing protein [Planctomycetes bacterium]|nr:DUF1579 domain-containing protein [Planctomycetota bacterium]